ncbi:MAG: RHS repeat-associated core domain-containing protein [Sulfurimonas sp.]
MGTVIEERSYEPFGEIRSLGIKPKNTTELTDKSFTGHEQIDEIDGLIHMGGRVYDSAIGRFTSADIHVPHPYSTQSYNRYSYVRNNPLGFVDPSGYSDVALTMGTEIFTDKKMTQPSEDQIQQDPTPTNGTSIFTRSGLYIPGPLEKIYFPDSPILNDTVASTLNFVNSGTNSVLNYMADIGEVMAPYDGVGYTMMMGGNPAQRWGGIGLVAVGKSGKVLLYIGTGGKNVSNTTNLLKKDGFYEVITEAAITGTTRSAHRNSANRALSKELESDSNFAQGMNDLLGTDVLDHMKSGKSALKNPLGTVWHHPKDKSNRMQLLRKKVHTDPELQDVLHGGGTGGYADFYK